MANKNLTFPGVLLIFAAVTFWLSWFLMPDQGTADTEHILNIVKLNRDSVYWSVIIQIISSVAYIPCLFLLATYFKPRRRTLIGIILLAIGAMGMCMDAFFHLLAYFMTDSSLNIQPDIVKLMTYMQTEGILFLSPLLLPFFIGSLLMAIGLYKQNLISKLPELIFIGAFAAAIVCGIIINTIFEGQGRSTLVLSVLGLFAIGQILIGFQLMKKRIKE